MRLLSVLNVLSRSDAEWKSLLISVTPRYERARLHPQKYAPHRSRGRPPPRLQHKRREESRRGKLESLRHKPNERCLVLTALSRTSPRHVVKKES